MIKNFLLFLAIVSASSLATARMSYDIGAATGTENNSSYTEMNLALNWYVVDWLNWRNAVFTRFGSEVTSVSGLDTSLLGIYEAYTEGYTFGFKAFAGPGLRFASANNNAATAEAGLIFKLGGIQIGGGARYMSYYNTREDRYRRVLPQDETQYFIVLAGGGSL